MAGSKSEKKPRRLFRKDQRAPRLSELWDSAPPEERAEFLATYRDEGRAPGAPDETGIPIEIMRIYWMARFAIHKGYPVAYGMDKPFWLHTIISKVEGAK